METRKIGSPPTDSCPTVHIHEHKRALSCGGGNRQMKWKISSVCSFQPCCTRMHRNMHRSPTMDVSSICILQSCCTKVEGWRSLRHQRWDQSPTTHDATSKRKFSSPCIVQSCCKNVRRTVLPSTPTMKIDTSTVDIQVTFSLSMPTSMSPICTQRSHFSFVPTSVSPIWTQGCERLFGQMILSSDHPLKFKFVLRAREKSEVS